MQEFTPDQLEFINQHADKLKEEMNVVINGLREQYLTQLEGFHTHTLNLESHYKKQVEFLVDKINHLESSTNDRHNELIESSRFHSRARSIATLMAAGNSHFQARCILNEIEQEIKEPR
jgi:hypothetical protein